MFGMIGNKEVAAHFGLIWREFGPRCALRCVGAMLRGRPTTFLDVAFDTSASPKPRGSRRDRTQVRSSR
jgi:hypothetical protein